MPGTGFGGMLANLFNPGLDQQVAASITPNPSPLAQQDQSKVPPVPGAPSNPAPGQAPPQVTQPDPALMQTNQLLMQGYLNQQRADSINHHIQGIGAAFGTAQQQHDAMAAWQGAQGGGGGAGYLDAIAKMQGIDATQTAQTEHARAAAGADLFAQTVFGMKPGQGNEAFNLGVMPDLTKAKMDSIFQGQTPTEQTKTYDQMHDRFIKGGGNEQDWNRFANPALIAGGIGGAMDPSEKDMQRDLMRWQADPANAGKPIPEEYTNVGKYKISLVTNTEKGKDLVADQHNFPTALGNYDKTISALDEFMKPDMQEAAKEFLGTTGQYNPVANMTNNGKRAWSLYKQIMGSQFSAGVQDFKGAGRITQQELNQDLPSQSTMGQLNQTPGDFADATAKYRDQLARRRAGLFGSAQMGTDPRLSDEDYAKYVAPNIDVLGGQRRSNDFSKLNDSEATAKIQALPSGSTFIGPDGGLHTRK